VAVLQGPKLLRALYQDAITKNENDAPLGFTNKLYGHVETIVLLHKEKCTKEDLKKMEEEMGIRIVVLANAVEDLMLEQKGKRRKPRHLLAEVTRDDVATLVYTSGTTGKPKGVELTHGNLLHQIHHRICPTQHCSKTEPTPGDTMLALLPVWHITERAFELFVWTRACRVVYSSVPSFQKDLQRYRPQWLVLVPRVLERVATGVQQKVASSSSIKRGLAAFFTKVATKYNKCSNTYRGIVVADKKPNALVRLSNLVTAMCLYPIHKIVGDKLVWSKVRQGFGGNVKRIIAGGSALAGHLDTFYENCGLPIVVGYGLSECSPLLAYRRGDANLIVGGCAGTPAHDTQIKLVDPETKRPVTTPGQPGVVFGRGPQVMRGYYNNPKATAEALDRDGWFDTGDLARINPATGDLIFTGRQKDTIVLSNGENIEPAAIEDAILSQSSLVDQVMLTGRQDGKSLLAICVLNPKELHQAGISTTATTSDLQDAVDKMNQPSSNGGGDNNHNNASRTRLQRATEEIRASSALQSRLKQDVQAATKSFRTWERVTNVIYTLEPFAMSNGLLTQSYKVKRDAVYEAFKHELI